MHDHATEIKEDAFFKNYANLSEIYLIIFQCRFLKVCMIKKNATAGKEMGAHVRINMSPLFVKRFYLSKK